MTERANSVDGFGDTSSPASQSPKNPGQKFTLLARIGRGALSWLVLGGLIALGYWGHHTGWTMPKFSTLMGHTVTQKDDWCEAHGVPESQCIECKSDIFPRGKEYGWCKKHGVHE